MGSAGIVARRRANTDFGETDGRQVNRLDSFPALPAAGLAVAPDTRRRCVRDLPRRAHLVRSPKTPWPDRCPRANPGYRLRGMLRTLLPTVCPRYFPTFSGLHSAKWNFPYRY